MNASGNSPFRGAGGKIFLIGFMGSGKTHWGKIWSGNTGLPFFDLDEVIEEQENKSIAAIFEQDGESYFRQRETEVLESFSGKANAIISCGGGTACFNNNMQWMNDNGTTVYFFASAPQIIHRIIDERAKRPVLREVTDDNLLPFIENKLTEREPFYRQAQIVLPVSDITASSIEKILQYE